MEHASTMQQEAEHALQGSAPTSAWGTATGPGVQGVQKTWEYGQL